jgi:hypothetical protein
MNRQLSILKKLPLFRLPTIFLLILLASCCGCKMLDPTMKEKRIVTPTARNDKTIIFNDSMVWGDRPWGLTRAIRFPKGKYIIEAEDDEYYYFKAPANIEYRIFKDKKLTDARNMPGGLFYKKYFNILPAGAYLSVSPTEKALTWKLGGDFLNMEGKLWKKNF